MRRCEKCGFRRALALSFDVKRKTFIEASNINITVPALAVLFIWFAVIYALCESLASGIVDIIFQNRQVTVNINTSRTIFNSMVQTIAYADDIEELQVS